MLKTAAAMLGHIERRLALVILLTAIIPLSMAAVFASAMLDYAKIRWIQPDVDAQLERGIDLYKDYIRAVKDDMKHQTDAMAGDEALRDAARAHDADATSHALEELFPRYPALVSLVVETDDGNRMAGHDRGRPLDDATERRLEQRRPLGVDGAAPMLVAVFAFDRRYEQDLARAGEVEAGYDKITNDRDYVYRPARISFAGLLGITAILTVVVGWLFARGVTRRIARLATAINRVAAGDLDVRVPVQGSDELTELARVFNRMVGEMQQSRARIEYLQRIGAWQEMAQRLAHEIKNPLTPIQLAVQECHRKYGGDDPKFRALLDTALEVVEEEVGTLRRLVGNFSAFARLPQAELHDASLRDFLRECSEKLGHLAADTTEDGSDAGEPLGEHDVEVRWELPDDATPVAIDRQMLRRVLVNLVRNAVESVRDTRNGAGGAGGHVVVHAEREPGGVAIVVEDDGPGVPETARERVFDPYFTTKAEGTGLGLAIVKKIVVEHNGAIRVRKSERLGGAAFVVSLPLAHSLASTVARESDSPAPQPAA
jgi:nitrogen fixation/metabolism regulation signal transduction histidine kinase